MPQTTWQAQVAYYRRRAAEYDLTSYGDVPQADRRIASLTELGWQATVTRSGPDWLLGEARPALRG